MSRAFLRHVQVHTFRTGDVQVHTFRTSGQTLRYVDTR
jgi:hypothetical protein